MALERRGVDGDWQEIASAVPDGEHRVTLVDDSVEPGATYEYRLRWIESGAVYHSGETRISVPRTLELSLEGLRPNPATRAGALRVAFTLPDDAPASIQLLDVSGRRVLMRDLRGLGPGQHVMSLESVSHLAPGIYFIRLQHDTRSIVRRGVVTR